MTTIAPPAPLTFDHLSSKWDRSGRSLLAAILRSIRGPGHTRGADIVSTTESADGARPEALERLSEGAVEGLGRRRQWRVLHRTNPFFYGENSLGFNASRFKVVDWTVVQIGGDLGPGLAHSAVIAVLEDRRTGHRVLYSVTHLPSDIEWRVRELLRRGGTMRARVDSIRDPRLRAYVRFARNWVREVAKMRRKYRPDVEVLAADFNLPLNEAWARAFLRAVFYGYKFPAAMDPTPTHAGGRSIDGFLIRTRRLGRRARRRARSLRRSVSRVLPPHPHSDHRGVRLSGLFPLRRPRHERRRSQFVRAA